MVFLEKVGVKELGNTLMEYRINMALLLKSDKRKIFHQDCKYYDFHSKYLVWVVKFIQHDVLIIIILLHKIILSSVDRYKIFLKTM
jgi:hypothetical protein